MIQDKTLDNLLDKEIDELFLELQKIPKETEELLKEAEQLFNKLNGESKR